MAKLLGSWNATGNCHPFDNQTSWSSATNATQAWGNFNVTIPGGASVDGIEVVVEARHQDPGCAVRARLGWTGGSSWSNAQDAVLTATDAVYTLGSATDTWGHSWSATDLSNARFQVRLENRYLGGACASNRRIDVDQIQARVSYHTSASPGSRTSPAPTRRETHAPGVLGVAALSRPPTPVGCCTPVRRQEEEGGARWDKGQTLSRRAAATTTPRQPRGLQQSGNPRPEGFFSPGVLDNQGSFNIGTGEPLLHMGGLAGLSSFYTLGAPGLQLDMPLDTSDDWEAGPLRQQLPARDELRRAPPNVDELTRINGQPEHTSGLSGSTT